MTTHELHTPDRVQLYVEAGSGTLTLIAHETDTTHIEILGEGADEVDVRQDGDQISVVAPQRRSGFFARDQKLDISISLPTRSSVVTRTGSMDLTASGAFGDARLKSGSGDLEIDGSVESAAVETGSGDLSLRECEGPLKIKSGSGDILLGTVGGESSISTGSGDVRIEASHGETAVKTGSGDLRVIAADAGVSLSTGSGDLVVDSARRGRVTLKSASGDAQIGIPVGTPVWTDISTVSGDISSNLESTGAPEEGADHVELRVKTVSGDVLLRQLR
jgi:DUF4097 and DUF4098 domain-containing protein YvlB